MGRLFPTAPGLKGDQNTLSMRTPTNLMRRLWSIRCNQEILTQKQTTPRLKLRRKLHLHRCRHPRWIWKRRRRRMMNMTKRDARRKLKGGEKEVKEGGAGGRRRRGE